MSDQHTPGPWAAHFEGGGSYVGREPVSVGSAHIMVGGSNREADARLIAAAPRMKKALERIRNRRGAHGYCLDCNVPPNTMHAESCSAFIADEAIADLPGEATNKPEGSDG